MYFKPLVKRLRLLGATSCSESNLDKGGKISGTYLPDSKGRLQCRLPRWETPSAVGRKSAAEASREKDPEKLLKLAKELERALDERDKKIED
jgi:hypothetical protein